jgi:hypothetical protein
VRSRNADQTCGDFSKKNKCNKVLLLPKHFQQIVCCVIHKRAAVLEGTLFSVLWAYFVVSMSKAILEFSTLYVFFCDSESEKKKTSADRSLETSPLLTELAITSIQ